MSNMIPLAQLDDAALLAELHDALKDTLRVTWSDAEDTVTVELRGPGADALEPGMRARMLGDAAASIARSVVARGASSVRVIAVK